MFLRDHRGSHSRISISRINPAAIGGQVADQKLRRGGLRRILLKLPDCRRLVLSQEDVSSENDKAADSNYRMDADHYAGDPGLENTFRKQRESYQRRQRDQ